MSESVPARSLGIGRQLENYLQGRAGNLPGQPVAIENLAEKAKSVLKREAYDYLVGGAGSEDTVRANRAAFDRWRIVPRFLRNVAYRDLAVEVLGQRLPAPIMLAPIGVQGIFHPDGEIPAARAAAALGLPFIVSSASSRTIEEVAVAMNQASRWFQLYWPPSDELASSFLKRAEQAGYRVVVVTVDTVMLAWRERDIQNAYLPFLYGEGLANYISDPVFCAAVGGDPRSNPAQHLRAVRQNVLRSETHLGQPGALDPIDEAAHPGQGSPASRRRAAGRRCGRLGSDRLEPWGPPARRCDCGARRPAPRR